MGLVISSYLADKYLVPVQDIEKSSDWFFNRTTEKETNDDKTSLSAFPLSTSGAICSDEISSSTENEIGDGHPFMGDTQGSEEVNDSSSTLKYNDEFKYIVFFNKTTIGYLSTAEEVRKTIEDVRSKVFRQVGFSPEYISYWREITNNESIIDELENGDVVFNSHFVQRNRNYIISYESILYRFKVVKAKCLSNLIKSE